MAFYQLKKEQFIKASIEDIWEFISSPQNLKKITPQNMGFDIRTSDLPDKIYEGMIISYTVRPLLGIPTNWVTEITHVREKSYFVDEQRVGPYKMWHHQHIILPAEDGVLMKDIVSYQPPLALLGRIANASVIKNKLDKIFNYRTLMIDKIFHHNI
ncbi:MAG: hypothetical protein CR986_04100 [Ignavibacteriae bacterium]|nr:MAG: hypothetical protein CR986_04100 [Ignavibacteriota bacterium]